MPKIPYVQTSVFVDHRYDFGGNQLATFWDFETTKYLSTEIMQGMALEMNFSESTFFFPTSKSECNLKVRIFTPARELPFAGHPTLGSTFVAYQKGIVPEKNTQCVLDLQVGPISVESHLDGLLRMKQIPSQFLNKWADNEIVARMVNLASDDLDTKYPIQWVSTGVPYLVIPVKSLGALKNASPNPLEIKSAIDNENNRMLLLFTTETENEDGTVHVRMFAPEVGVDEDPATGSAAGPLAAYISQYNVVENPEDEIVIEQGYEIRRPSKLLAQAIGKGGSQGVYVSGKTRLIAEGLFYL